jgi:myo-inositol-1(or 4)-monophosphatase
MFPSDYERIACEAARAGGAVLRARFRDRSIEVEHKGLHDFVTAVDREAEAAVLELLHARCPGHAVMAEESAPKAAFAAYRWVVDPLDGTTNFIHGVPVFGVSIALEDDRGPLAGAIYDPIHDELFHAHRGGGARLNGEPIHCSPATDPHQMLVATGFPFRELSRLEGYMRVFESVLRSTAGLRRAGAACIDLAYTACGRYDGFFEIGLSRWDISAGALLVLEAGGVVSDVLGSERYLESGDIVAAGRSLHPRLLEVTREALG